MTYVLVSRDVAFRHGDRHVACNCLEVTAAGVDIMSGWVRPTQSTDSSEEESA